MTLGKVASTPLAGACRLGGYSRIVLLALGLVAGVMTLSLSRPSEASHVPSPPNVLFIVSDDQRIGTMDALPRTMERWFLTDTDTKGATEFSNAFVTTPICCPSRASIFTGQYEHNHGVKNNDGTLLGTTPQSPGQQTTLQYYLHEKRAYRTGIFGKYLNNWGLDNPPPFFDQYSVWDSGPPKAGFLANEPGGPVRVPQYETSYVEQKALSFLNSPSSAPFFLYLAPTIPHEPFEAEPQWSNLSVPTFDPPPVSLQNDRSNKPYDVQKELRDPPGIAEDATAQRRMLKSVDVMIDRVLQSLEDQNKLDDTLVFFISDNGYLLGEHGLSGKATPYLESVRVPAFSRWPAGGIGSAFSSLIPRVDDRLVANIDMTPTVLDANHVEGAELNAPLDGMSLLDPGNSRNRMLTEMFGTAVGDTALRFASITTPTFSYTEHFAGSATIPETEYVDSGHNVSPQDADSGAIREFYDIRPSPPGDAAQQTNLLRDGSRENDPPADLLSGQLASDLQCSGSTCPGPSNQGAIPIEVQFTSEPDDGSADRTPTFAFTSSEPAATFHCQLDAQTIPDPQCQSPYTVPSSNLLAPGPHTFQVTAEYPTGNVGSKTVSWDVGTTPKVRLSLNGSQPRKLSNDPTPTFAFDASENTVRVECRVDGNLVNSNCVSPWTHPGLVDGKHTFTATAVGVGATSDPSPPAYTWWIDTTAPSISFYSSPFGWIPDSSATIGFQASSSNYGSGDGIGGFECSVDGGPFTRCGARREVTSASGAAQYRATLTGLSNATHTVRVRAIDLAGNIGQAASQSFGWANKDVPSTFEDLPDTRWPDIVAGTDGTTEAQVVIPDGAGGWYVGGTFDEVRDSVAGESTHPNIFHIKSDMSVDTQWTPWTDGPVSAMVLSPDGSRLYIGGSFSTVSGTPRSGLAAITTTAPGNVAADWNPTAMRDCTSGADVPAAVTALALGTSPLDPSTVYVAGNFTNISDVARSKVAALPLMGSGPTMPTPPTAWSPPIDADPADDCVDPPEAVHIVYALAVTPFGKIIVGGDKDLKVEGQVRSIAQFDRTTSARDTWWDPRPDHNVRALEISGSNTVLVGGNFLNLAGLPRAKAARIQIGFRIGQNAVTAWTPSARRVAQTDASFQGYVQDFIDLGSKVIAGGQFDFVKSDVPRSRLAELGGDYGAPTKWAPTLNSVPAAAGLIVNGTSYSGGVLAVAGEFDAIDGSGRQNLAFFQTRSPSSSQVLSLSTGSGSSARPLVAVKDGPVVQNAGPRRLSRCRRSRIRSRLVRCGSPAKRSDRRRHGAHSHRRARAVR